MRHYLFVLSLPLAPPPLSGSVARNAAPARLVTRLGLPLRLAPADTRALPGAVNVAVIAAFTDAHLHRASLTIVEPIRRLPHDQAPSRGTRQRSGGQA
ncbi:MAG: hypothetical protein ABI145_17975 [Steroidobacteraceae bacterium]